MLCGTPGQAAWGPSVSQLREASETLRACLSWECVSKRAKRRKAGGGCTCLWKWLVCAKLVAGILGLEFWDHSRATVGVQVRWQAKKVSPGVHESQGMGVRVEGWILFLK